MTIQLEHYRLIGQITATKQYSSYEATDARDDRQVRIIEFNHHAIADWSQFGRELLKRQLVQHSNALPILEVDLESEPPRIVAGWQPIEPLGPAYRPPLDLVEVFARILAEILQQAHRFGVRLGCIFPERIGISAAQELWVDLADLPQLHQTPPPRWCHPNDTRSGESLTFAADVFSWAATLYWLLNGPLPETDRPLQPADVARIPTIEEADFPVKFRDLLARSLDPEPELRPTATELLERMELLQNVASGADRHAVLNATTPEPHGTMVESRSASTLVEFGQEACMEAPMPTMLGRFEILEQLGTGGMGTVYRARDTIDNSIVAVKTLRPELAKNPYSLRRFLKEARMLSEVSNPYVTNLLEVNEDNGIHYIVMEYVAGLPVNYLLRSGRAIPESFALRIVACVARALAEPHERGIVHRDVKPSNILLVDGGAQFDGDEAALDVSQTQATIAEFEREPQVKLSDFGLARYVTQSESLEVTRAGAVVGTPYYMSPEQCTGKDSIDARSDVYSLGATLFHLLSGRPPFLADDAAALANLHCNAPVPKLQSLNDRVSDAAQQIVDKALSKSPEDRYQTAGEMLDDIERVLRGEPTAAYLHPLLPTSESGKPVATDHTWHLNSSPQQLWPYVANTDRLNHALGLPAVEYRTLISANQQLERIATAKISGMVLEWKEHPFEWVEGRRFGVLREFKNGPFHWFATIVELSPKVGGGTILTQRFRIEPRGLMGRTLAKVNFGNKTKRALGQIYTRIDAVASGKLAAKIGADPFEEPVLLSPSVLRKFDTIAEELLQDERLVPIVIRKLVDYVATAPDPEVARIRPLALAEVLGVDGNAMVDVCLQAAHKGLLVLLWDLLCPVCRIASEVKQTLRELRDHGHCEACNLDFELDFANSVEMIFQVHPNLRKVERKTYCIGGPAHSPHVMAQIRLAPGETVSLELALSEGTYRLRGPQLPYWHELRVRPGDGLSRWEHAFSAKGAGDTPILRLGKQTLRLGNRFQTELLVRVERVTQRDDALTAARACANATFRELYPNEVLTPGQLVNVAAVTFLATDLVDGPELYRRLGDAKAFAILHEHFRILDDAIRKEAGAMVKTLGQGVLAVFNDSVNAVRAAVGLQNLLRGSENTNQLKLRVAVHYGTAMAATLNDRLDYFGTTVNDTLQLASRCNPNEILLTHPVASDPSVFEFLTNNQLRPEIIADDSFDFLLHCIREG